MHKTFTLNHTDNIELNCTSTARRIVIRDTALAPQSASITYFIM